VNLLLDTHALLWAASGDARLTDAVRGRLATAPGRYVSAASAYEIAMKTRLGKLRGGGALLDGWTRLLGDLQAEELPLTTAHMARAGALAWAHRDPFDRMLVAQAQLEALTVVTDDRAIREFDGVRSAWG